MVDDMFSKSDHLLRIINEDARPLTTSATGGLYAAVGAASPRAAAAAVELSSSGSSSPSPVLCDSYTSSSSSSSYSSSPSPASTSHLPDYSSLNRYHMDRASSKRRLRRKLSGSSSGSSAAGELGDFICSLSHHSLNSMRRICLLLIGLFLLVQLFNYVFYVSNRSSLFSMSYFKDVYEYRLAAEAPRHDLDPYRNSSAAGVYENVVLSGGNVSAAGNASRRGPFRRLVDLVNLTAEAELTERDLERHEHDGEFERALFEVREALAGAYESIDAPVEYCSNNETQIEGFLNSRDILARINLTGLVTFYADSLADAQAKKDEEKKDQEGLRRMNEGLERLGKRLVKGRGGKILKKKDFERLRLAQQTTTTTSTTPASTTTTTLDPLLLKNELYLLKTSKNFSLLNVSSDVFGYDGGRVQLGGFWRPRGCQSNFKLGVIIPYRDRLAHLKVLLNYLHLVLQRQLIEYRIFVVEPTTPLDIPFNKGRIMNSAYLEALKLNPDIDCFVFHDVDLVPEDDRNLYTCSSMPRHMSVAIDKFNYILPYSYLVGGVFNIRTDQYRRINGYSNMYWGWGGEDDDLAERIASEKLIIHRPPSKLARYKMMKHEGQKLNPQRHKHLRTAQKRYKNDGVNQVKYDLVSTTLYTGFTHFLVEIGLPDKKK